MSLLYFFAKRFIAGETLDEALPNLETLKAQGFLTTIDHLGENVTNKKDSEEAVEYYLKIIDTLKEKKLNINLSVKLTQLGLNIDQEFCLDNLKKIGKRAQEVGGFIRVDGEDSSTTSTTLNIIKAVRENNLPVGGTIQTMLRRSPMNTVTYLENNTRIRLCKGAYKETVDIAYQDQKEVNRQFVALMKRLLTSGVYHGLATHDERIITLTKKFAKEQRISPESFEFQFLYGIRFSVAKKLLAQGWKVRIYCPFGHAWLPYTYRRLRERKENVWFVMKNLFRN